MSVRDGGESGGAGSRRNERDIRHGNPPETSLPVRITLFGELKVDVPGNPAVTRFRTRKTAAILAYLALRTGQSQPREVLGELLWPDVPPASQRVSLSAALHTVRGILEPAGYETGSVLIANRHQVGLNRDRVVTDVMEFETLLEQADGLAAGLPARAETLERATRLYGQGLLPGFYEAWLVREQERLAARQEDALLHLVAAWETTGSAGIAAAIDAAQRAVDSNPLSEYANHALIRLLAQSGRASAALQTFAKLEARYMAELHAESPAGLRNLVDDVRAGKISGIPALPPPDPVIVAPPVTFSKPARNVPPSPPSAVSDNPGAPAIQDFEMGGGAVPLNSRFYLERPAGRLFYAALDRGDSIVLLKGARQVGKTSLLARGLNRASMISGNPGDTARTVVVLTDFQKISRSQMESEDVFCRVLALAIARQLRFSYDFAREWHEPLGGNLNLEQFLRSLLDSIGDRHLIWFVDEADKLFGAPFASDFFGLIRSWHNARTLDAAGPWGRLTLAIAYATEAHLFIRDMNQSPFNVGTVIELQDFTLAESALMNERHNSPLDEFSGLPRLQALVGGHPYLTRGGLAELATQPGIGSGPAKDAGAVDELAQRALREEGVFSRHLRRLRFALEMEPEMARIVRGMLDGEPCPSDEVFYRLRSAGILRGDARFATGTTPAFRCELYAAYLRRHLVVPD